MNNLSDQRSQNKPVRPPKVISELSAKALFRECLPDFRGYRPPTTTRPDWAYVPHKVRP